MERRLYANDNETALRAAHRLGGVEPAIAKARVAVNEKASNAKALLEALPSSAQSGSPESCSAAFSCCAAPTRSPRPPS